jgi:hypothetical protein
MTCVFRQGWFCDGNAIRRVDRVEGSKIVQHSLTSFMDALIKTMEMCSIIEVPGQFR